MTQLVHWMQLAHLTQSAHLVHSDLAWVVSLGEKASSGIFRGSNGTIAHALKPAMIFCIFMALLHVLG